MTTMKRRRAHHCAPGKEVPAGHYLVHNIVMWGGQGFRSWIQSDKSGIKLCKCRAWSGDKHANPHYRVVMTVNARIHSVAPLKCSRRDSPDCVRRYAAMLRAGQKAPPICVVKQRRGSRHRYRIEDGAHRFRAAKRVGRKTIEVFIMWCE